jgi:hypothetical protein
MSHFIYQGMFYFMLVATNYYWKDLAIYCLLTVILIASILKPY